MTGVSITVDNIYPRSRIHLWWGDDNIILSRVAGRGGKVRAYAEVPRGEPVNIRIRHSSRKLALKSYEWSGLPVNGGILHHAEQIIERVSWTLF